MGGVFVNADGYKKSIPGPGIGNYLTVGKAMGLARAMLGEDGLQAPDSHAGPRDRHTPEPGHRIAHSQRDGADIRHRGQWPVGAVKAYVGHSMAPAGGDQLAAVLGTWEHGWLPGITTIDHIAEDVYQSHLAFPLNHVELDPATLDGAFINSKGFGGNNATGFFLSPAITEKMLARRWGADRMLEHRRKNEAVIAQAETYNSQADGEDISPIYQFGEGVVEGEDLTISEKEIQIPGFGQPVSLTSETPGVTWGTAESV